MMQLRTDLEKELGYRLPEMTWNVLDELGFVEDAEGSGDISTLVAYVRAMRQPVDRANEVDSERRRGADALSRLELRTEAIGAWLSRIANRSDRHISQWRRRHLPDGLLAAESVDDWIRTQLRRYAAEDGQRLEWLAPDGDDWTLARSAVPRRSPLDELADVSRKVADTYAWGSAAAVMLILTGRQLVTFPMQVARLESRHSGSGPEPDFDVATRVTITVEPSVSPDELAAWWAIQRRPLLSRRYTPMSEKHLRLAVFAAEHEHGGVTWEQLRPRWNNRVEGEGWPVSWQYGADQRGNFARDAGRAPRRLLWVGYRTP